MRERSYAQKEDQISLSDISRPRILVTRPLPQGEQTAEKLRALGYAPVLAPMLRIEPITPPKLPSFDKVQAVLVTSRNGIARLSALDTILAKSSRTKPSISKSCPNRPFPRFPRRR